MNLLGTPEFKVGVLVVVVAGLIGFMSLKVSEGPGVFGGSHSHYFTVDDAGGLVENSAVKMAGIKVGIIKKIELKGHKARIYLQLEDDVKLSQSSKVELRSDGILGDRHVELIPGEASDQPLPDGSEIATADGSGGLNQVMQEVGKITKSLNELVENLNKANKGEGDPSTPVGRIVMNIEKLTKDIAEITDRNKSKIDNIVDRVENLSRNIDNYINEETLARVNKSIQNIEEITNKLNNGEGTLGRLINDEETVEELNTAISNVNEFLGGAQKMETSIDFHSEFLTNDSLTKSYLGVKLQPGVDRYYEVQVVDDPQGVKSSSYTEVVDETGHLSTEDKTITFKNKIKLTILFAKNFYDFTIKGGLIENSGGFGMDYYLLNRNMRASVEFFNFQDLYMRAFLRYNFFKGIYVIAGGDNLLASGDTDLNAFIGAGLFLTNDDLKMLASKVSF
jgi:phospholipid/cholesterol/gamma-HCH transport system substrate-binding protein